MKKNIEKGDRKRRKKTGNKERRQEIKKGGRKQTEKTGNKERRQEIKKGDRKYRKETGNKKYRKQRNSLLKEKQKLFWAQKENNEEN